MASPHVAAVAALIKSEQPSLTAAEIRQLLHDTADNTVTPDCGFGLVDAQRALEAAAVGDHPPTASIFRPTAGSMRRRAASRSRSPPPTRRRRPATSIVEWSRDGTSWQLAAYNAGSRLLRGRVGHHRRARRQPGDAAGPRHRQRDPDDRGDAGDRSGSTTRTSRRSRPSATRVTRTCASFNASASSDADGTTLDYAWSFGDGQSGAGKTMSHTFTATGTYAVDLTVTDELGATGSTREERDDPGRSTTRRTSPTSTASAAGWSSASGRRRITIRIADTLRQRRFRTPGSPGSSRRHVALPVHDERERQLHGARATS